MPSEGHLKRKSNHPYKDRLEKAAVKLEAEEGKLSYRKAGKNTIDRKILIQLLPCMKILQVDVQIEKAYDFNDTLVKRKVWLRHHITRNSQAKLKYRSILCLKAHPLLSELKLQQEK